LEKYFQKNFVFYLYIKSIVVSLPCKQKQIDMPYVKISDRNLSKKEVVIISKKLGTHKKIIFLKKYAFNFVENAEVSFVMIGS